MPVDPAALRRVAEHLDKVLEAMRTISQQLEGLDPSRCQDVADAASTWEKIVNELQASVEGQQGLSRDMRESARIQDEQQSEDFRDRYRFLIDRLKVDIRTFFQAMPDFVDLPQDFQRQRTWSDCVYDMEMDIKSLSAVNAGETGLANVDPIVALLNFRDKVLSLMLSGVLFQKAVLDWDLKSERAYADGPMVEMAESVVNLYSKNESLPAKHRPSELPSARDPGPFTYNASSKQKPGDKLELTALQCRLLTTMRELQSMDKGVRHMKFGEKVHITERGRSSGRSASDDLRKEFTKWHQHATELEQMLRVGRFTKGPGVEMQVERLLQALSEKDKIEKERKTRIHKLEGDVQSLKYELVSLRREKGELHEKNNKMAKENIPVLERMKDFRGKTQEAVARLQADAAVLSEKFRLMVKNNKAIGEEAERTAQELEKVSQQLEVETSKNLAKEGELQRKETLYLRTMAARKSIHESCLEQTVRIEEIECRRRQREGETQEMLKVAEGRDSELSQLRDELSRARARADELEHQVQACMEEFQTETGRPSRKLLERFKAVPTLATR